MISYGGPQVQTQQHILETQQTIFGTQHNIIETQHNFIEIQHNIWETQINNSLHLARKYAQIFVRGRLSVPRSEQFSGERSSRKTVSFEEQIMSKDKYLSIFFKSNWGYCVYYPSNIFRNTQDLPVCHMSIMSVFQLASKISTSFNSDFASVESICLRKKYIILKEK